MEALGVSMNTAAVRPLLIEADGKLLCDQLASSGGDSLADPLLRNRSSIVPIRR